ncbi:MIT (microtubule interacting and transport) domain family protein [Acanthocheilonema viteae]
MQSFIDKSKPILQKAVALDRDNKKDEAVENYVEGITLLLRAMSCDDTVESAREALREKISKYLTRAEVLKGQMKPEILSVQQIHIMHNDTGFGYERIFKRCADNDLTEINVRDAYIMLPYQVLNFVRFCELFVLHAPNLKTIRLWTHYDARAEGLLQQLKGSLLCHNIELDVCYDQNFHDREIRFSNGWMVKIGRGLNYFQSVGHCEIGSCDLNLRKCHETSIDIFKFKQPY